MLYPLVVHRPAIVVAAVALFAALAPAAFGGGVYAEVVSPTGKVLAVADGPSFDFPADGSLVHVGSAEGSSTGVMLADVALFGSVVQATQLYLPSGRGDAISGTIAAAGQLFEPAPNLLVPLGGGGYAIVDQRAKSRGRIGRIGLRLVVGRAAFGVPAGTQVLLGVPAAAHASRSHAVRSVTQIEPLAALGFSSDDASFLGFTPAPSATSGSIGGRAVAIAQRFLGVPYVWGGASPLTGFDCSGLTMYVYAQLGISLTHYTGAQFTQGLRLSREELEPGDLVFFDGAADPQHEGIYIGGGRFIHAPHTGDVVKISSLDDAGYGFGFVGAVRPYGAQ
jgi:cell wall-associated NlpC family hydrolase